MAQGQPRCVNKSRIKRAETGDRWTLWESARMGLKHAQTRSSGRALKHSSEYGKIAPGNAKRVRETMHHDDHAARATKKLMLDMTNKMSCQHEIWISEAGRKFRRQFVTSPGFKCCDRGRRRLDSFVNSSSAQHSEDAANRRELPHKR